MNWSEGDMAVVHGLVDDLNFNGLVITIVETNVYFDGYGECVLSDFHENYFLLVNLKPIDGYDGYETTSWEKCVWQPKEVVYVETT